MHLQDRRRCTCRRRPGATGLLLGAAFAMVWRPVAMMRGPLRDKGRSLDVVAVVGLVGLGALCWYLHIVTPDGRRPVAVPRRVLRSPGWPRCCVIAAVTHRRTRGRAAARHPPCCCGSASARTACTCTTGRSTRSSAGWPGGRCRSPSSSPRWRSPAVVTEISYRFIETPIRRGHVGRWWRRLQARARSRRRARIIAGAGAGLVAAVGVRRGQPGDRRAQAERDRPVARRGAERHDVERPRSTCGAADRRRPSRRRPATSRRRPVAAGRRPRPARRRCRRRRARRPPPTTTAARPRRVPPATADPRHRRLGDARRRRRARRAEGIVVDAEVSRQMKTMVPVVQAAPRRRDSSATPSSSTSAPTATLSDETVNEFFSALARRAAGARADGPRARQAAGSPPTTPSCVALPAQFPNVKVLVLGRPRRTSARATASTTTASTSRQAGQDYYTAADHRASSASLTSVGADLPVRLGERSTAYAPRP